MFEKSFVVEPTVINLNRDGLPPRFARRIFRASFLTLSSVAVALALHQPAYAALAAAVFASSVNYWRRPMDGWRRLLDMVIVASVMLLQLHWARGNVYGGAYALTCGASAACYAKARATADFNRSTLWHVGVHICANAGNMMLYAGEAHGGL